MVNDAKGLVTRSITDGVAVITLNDPARRNALSGAMSTALAAAVDDVLGAAAAAIVLTATPPVFCSGGSLDDLIAPTAPLREMYTGFLRLAEAPIPTIAAVGGPAIGAGVNLPLACDLILTSPSAVFDPRFLDVGIHPGGGHLWRLSQRIGSQGAAALVVLGDRLDGREAEARGLAWRCVPDDQLLATALDLAGRAARRDTELVRRTKASLRAGAAIGDPNDAIEIELAAQEWSVSRPGFVENVTKLRDRIRTGKTVNRR